MVGRRLVGRRLVGRGRVCGVRRAERSDRAQVNFDPLGFVLALLSSLTQSIQSVQSKALLVHA